MNRLFFASLTLFALACNRGTAPSGPLPQAAETARKLAQEAPPVPAPSLDPKVLVTDGNIGRYIIYQKEMNTVSDLVMGAAVGAFNKSGGSQKGFEKALSQDERLKKIADTEASALAKSGFTRTEAQEIAKVVSTYTPGATMGDAEMKKTAREEFSAKYSPVVLAVMEKRLPELSKLQDEMLEATLGKKK
jgi:hypothetical protein